MKNLMILVSIIAALVSTSGAAFARHVTQVVVKPLPVYQDFCPQTDDCFEDNFQSLSQAKKSKRPFSVFSATTMALGATAALPLATLVLSAAIHLPRGANPTGIQAYANIIGGAAIAIGSILGGGILGYKAGESTQDWIWEDR